MMIEVYAYDNHDDTELLRNRRRHVCVCMRVPWEQDRVIDAHLN